MYSIGEFSKITGLSTKALRLYHERGLLLPERVDENTGYRYYRLSSLDKARAIAQLRVMTFSLDEIQTIVGACEDEAEIVGYLEERGRDIARKMKDLRRIANSIQALVDNEKEAKRMSETNLFEIEEVQLDDLLIAGIRWKGRYDESGAYFGKLYKAMARHACGKPLGLYHDPDYVEEGADIECCVPVRKGSDTGDIKVYKLTGGKAISLLYKGPYPDIGRAYERVFGYAKDKELVLKTPSRLVYRKGPGMIFKGNPKNYITELQVLIE